jgi:AcrR family transcriptional regulator
MARPADRNAKVDLLAAAEAVFSEHGLDQARVDDITARAGKSKGAFYLHFESKEEAFREIIESLLARLHACVREQTDAALPSSPSEYMKIWHAKDLEIFEFFWQNRRLMRLLFEGGRSADYAYLTEAFAERSRAATEPQMRAAVAAGLLRDDFDVNIGIRLVSGAYEGVARDVIRLDTKPDLAHITRELQRFILLGLASPGLRRGVLENDR